MLQSGGLKVIILHCLKHYLELTQRRGICGLHHITRILYQIVLTCLLRMIQEILETFPTLSTFIYSKPFSLQRITNVITHSITHKCLLNP